MGADGYRAVRRFSADGWRSRAVAALVILGALLLGSPVSTGAEPGVGGGAAWPPLGATVFGTEGVRLRTCPSLDCEAVAVAKLGERLTVTGPIENGFSPVDYGGALGFAYDLYLAKDGQPLPSLVEGQPGCKRIALIFNVGIGERPVLE